MKRSFEELVSRFGRSAARYDREGTVTAEGMAFLQSVTEKERQRSAGALGAFRTDRFLCLTPVALDPGQPGDGGWIECGGERYTVMAAHPIYLGREQTHWWAVLEVRDEDKA